METISRNVRDLGEGERSVMEQLVGHHLADEQKLVIQVFGGNLNSEPIETETDALPDWCNVYQGLTDDQIADIEKSIVRCNVCRSIE